MSVLSTRDNACHFIEKLAMGKGTFSDAFKQEAKEEARSGRKGMLQAIQGSEEIRADLAKALQMYEPSAVLYGDSNEI